MTGLSQHGGEPRELKAGTVYALLLNDRISAQEAERIADCWREYGPGENDQLGIGGMKIEELDDDRLRELGLSRVED